MHQINAGKPYRRIRLRKWAKWFDEIREPDKRGFVLISLIRSERMLDRVTSPPRFFTGDSFYLRLGFFSVNRSCVFGFGFDKGVFAVEAIVVCDRINAFVYKARSSLQKWIYGAFLEFDPQYARISLDMHKKLVNKAFRPLRSDPCVAQLLDGKCSLATLLPPWYSNPFAEMIIWV
ncbi:hypothetical protein E3N88_21576 [Mikania micrantha]|uniref:Uncharacterized protein n=1 Tax=Mikania micrantha TaxID=192012 RepID=A0A5N6NAK9_9ASTR|nr:hypothetical protein E3N88_21576 [Mikania micrantha]